MQQHEALLNEKITAPSQDESGSVWPSEHLYRYSCSCGWQGAAWYAREARALRHWERHVDGLAVKAAEQLAAERGVPDTKRAIELATAEGTVAGVGAGSWVVDGNTAPEEAARIVRGYDDGDPEILDMCPSPLSGEWADGVLPADVLEPFGRTADDDDADDILTAYETGYTDGYWSQVMFEARPLAEPDAEPEPEPIGSYNTTNPAIDALRGAVARGVAEHGAIVEVTDAEPEPVGASCSQCGAPMNPAARMLGPVCGDCVRRNHRAAIGEP